MEVQHRGYAERTSHETLSERIERVGVDDIWTLRPDEPAERRQIRGRCREPSRDARGLAERGDRGPHRPPPPAHFVPTRPHEVGGRPRLGHPENGLPTQLPEWLDEPEHGDGGAVQELLVEGEQEPGRTCTAHGTHTSERPVISSG